MKHGNSTYATEPFSEDEIPFFLGASVKIYWTIKSSEEHGRQN